MRWIIGDIHGMVKPLAVLVDAVFARDPDPLLIFVGDYVNRGPDSRGVVELLLSLPSDHAKFCRGNHDDIFDLILNGKSHAAGTDPVPVFSWFMAHGLDRTLISYGIDEAMMQYTAGKPNAQRVSDLVSTVPQHHRSFFRNLPLAIEMPDIFIVHAKWHPDESDMNPDLIAPIAQSTKMKHRVLWERFSDQDIVRKKHWKRRGFFGHTPVVNYMIAEDYVPIVSDQCVLLDTAVALSTSGRLTAFCVETDQMVQASHFAEVIES